MREIKFRAWDKVHKKLVLLDDMWICNEYSSLAFASSQKEYQGICMWPESGGSGDTDSQIIMQFTGLLDKNGKEIYEGDIFRHTMHDSIEVVSWDDHHGGYKMPNSFDEEYIVYLGDIDGIEVIGNIYEHGDLLK